MMRYKYASSAPNFSGGPGYGKRSFANGGTVTIGSMKPGGVKPSYRRVSVAPAFDPLAVSMIPVPGWHPGDLYIPGSRLYRTDLDGNPIAA